MRLTSLLRTHTNIKSIFSIFIIFALILGTEQRFAHACATDGPTIKVASSTLNAHDDVEIHKALHQGFMLRTRKVFIKHSPAP